MLTSLRQRLSGWLHAIRLAPPPMGGDPAPVPARDDLWAVWPYDRFPYYLCGQIESFTEQGKVKVKGYTGMTFKPVTILHGKNGEDFRAYLTAARTVYSSMEECLRNACGDEIVKACTKANVPPPPGAWRPGYRGYGMAEAFNRGIAEIHAGRAPAHAYGQDVRVASQKG